MLKFAAFALLLASLFTATHAHAGTLESLPLTGRAVCKPMFKVWVDDPGWLPKTTADDLSTLLTQFLETQFRLSPDPLCFGRDGLVLEAGIVASEPISSGARGWMIYVEAKVMNADGSNGGDLIF